MAETEAPVKPDTPTQEPVDQPSWLESFSPEFRENPALTKYKSHDELAKGFLEAQKLVGKEKVPIPGEDAKPEDWDMVFNRLGRPEKPENYEFPEVEMPEELKFNEEAVAEWKSDLHKLGLSQRQSSELFKLFSERQKTAFLKMQEQKQVSMQEGETKLRSEFGTAYVERLTAANKATKKLAGENFEAVNQKFGNDPDFIRMMSKVGEIMGEDSLGHGTGKTLSRTPEEAKAEITKLQGEYTGNPKHPMNDPLHPEHEVTVKKMNDLYKEAYPSK